MASNRERRRSEKLERILDAAAALTTKDGLESLTLQRLGDAMAVTPAALYRYIESRDDLLTRLQTRSLNDLGALLSASVESWRRSSIVTSTSTSARPLVPILAVGIFYIRLSEKGSIHVQLLTEMVGDPRLLVPEKIARRVVPAWDAILVQLAELIEEAASTGALDTGPAKTRAALQWSSLHGVAQTEKLRRLDSDLFSPASMVLELGAGLLLRWGAKPEHVEEALTNVKRLRMRS